MSVAVRTITDLKYLDDVNVTVGAGVDGYALTWDNGAGAFVLAAAGVTDHGALSGLSDDDHTGYALLAGRSGGQTLYGGTASGNNLTLYSTSHATKGNIALGTTLTVDSVNGRVGIGTTNPQAKLDVNGSIQLPNTSQITLGTTWGSGILYFNNGASTFGSWGPGSLTTNVKMLAASNGAPNAPEYGFRDSVSTGMYRPANNQIGFAINAIERLRIDSSGNVGIGTTAPGTKLEVANGVTGQLTLLKLTNSFGSAGNSADIDFSVSNSSTVFGRIGALRTDRAVAGDTALTFSTYSNSALGEKMRILDNGNVGIGTTSPSTILHALTTDTAINAVTNIATLGHDTSGTAAAGFGAGQLFALESSTTAAQSAARIQALWYEATHATRKADLVLTAYDTAEREGLRIRGAGSAAAIGFLGATPAARIAHVADPAGGGTVDAEARSAINSILATLETFGFHATS